MLALALGLEQVELGISDGVVRAALIEIASCATTGLSPAVSARLDKWRDAGNDVRAASIAGPAFWQTTEIEECPALIGASLQLMAETDSR